MADRFRALLDHPLDPRVARAVVAANAVAIFGLAALVALGALAPDQDSSPGDADRTVIAREPASAEALPASDPAAPARPHPRTPRQDPQDVEGSAAARRAARALRSHRALQHVPYRDGELAIVLVGARGHRAVLRVSAPTVTEARRGWKRFLLRYRDSGRAYVPIFKGKAGSSDG